MRFLAAGHQASSQRPELPGLLRFKSCSHSNKASRHLKPDVNSGRKAVTAQGHREHQGRPVRKPGLGKESWGAQDGGLPGQMLWGGALPPRPRGAVTAWSPFLLTRCVGSAGVHGTPWFALDINPVCLF